MKTILHLFQIALSLSLAITAYAQPSDIRQGLVAYWPLDVNNGGTTPDLAFINTLNVVGSPVVGAGRVNNAFTFNGSSTYLTNLHSPDNSATGLPIYRAGSYTIAMWVKGAGQTAKYLFTEGNTNTAGSTAGQNPLLLLQTGQAAANSNKFDVIIRNDTGGTLVNHVVSTNVVFDNNWHHVAWVDDRGSVKLYVDGNLDAANFNYTPSGNFTFNTTAIGTLIRAGVSTGNIFNGQIDDLGLWERALSQAEVQQMRDSSLVTPVPPLPPAIVTQPIGGTRRLGDRIVLLSRAVGTRPLNVLGYQWFKDGVEVLGATANTLTLTNLTPADSGNFSVRVTNSVGDSVTSAVAALTVLPDPVPDVAQGLVSYWPMNDINNGEFGRVSTPDLYSHNDFTLVTTGFFDSIPGVFGNGILFDGIEQYGVRAGGFPIYNNPAFSVALWVNAVGTNQSDRRFFGESSTNSVNPLFVFGSNLGGTNGLARVYIRNDAGVVLVDRNTTRTVLDGTWHHFVWTETNGQARLYVDGALDDTDFNYTRGTTTLNTTAIGALVRATVAAFINGGLQDVAVWNRILSFTEIQQIRTVGIPPPFMTIPPGLTQDPASQSVLTRANVTFSFLATGTSPLAPQWRKNGADLGGETNFTLVLTNVVLGDAGDYTVVVTNAAGSATSQVATLTVSLRPSPPSTLKVDFNNLGNETAADTEPGFESFALPVFGQGPVTRSFGGADVTLSGIGVNLESRKRLTPTNMMDFTEERLLQDFIFARDTTAATGMDLALEFLEPNQIYGVTIWSFDSSSGGNRVSDWTANAVLVRSAYAFDGASLPVTNDRYRFGFDATSDGAGKILIQGRRNSGTAGTFNVFLNALQLIRRDLRVQQIELLPPDSLRLTILMRDPLATHRVEQKTNLTDAEWTEVPNVFFGEPSGLLLPVIFSVPDTATRFYRVAEVQ